MIGAWVKLMWNSATVAAVAAAAQLGVANVLGIIRWNDDEPAPAIAWSALLTWVAFSYTVAVLIGALIGRRAVPRSVKTEGVGARITAAVLAAVGGAAAIPLAWLPAQGAKPPVPVDPALVVSITAGAGVVVGLVVALIALAAPPVAVGLRAAVAWLWLVAVGCAAAGIATHRPYAAPRLGVLDAPSIIPVAWWSGSRVMIAVAAILAIVVASVARWGGAGRFGIALAGFGGPAVVAAAYLVAGPGVGSDRTAQFEPYQAALLATGVGLIVSVLIAMPTRRASRPARTPLDPGEGFALFGDVMTAEPAPAMAGAAPSYGSGSHGSGTFGSPSFGSASSRSASSSGQYGSAYPSYVDDTSSRSTMDYPTSEQHLVPQGSTYTGTTYGPTAGQAQPVSAFPGGAPATTFSAFSTPSAGPVMGQPPSNDPHESWLGDLRAPDTGSGSRDTGGPTGRHSLEDRQPRR